MTESAQYVTENVSIEVVQWAVERIRGGNANVVAVAMSIMPAASAHQIRVVTDGLRDLADVSDKGAKVA